MQLIHKPTLDKVNDDLKALAHDSEELLKAGAGQLNEKSREVRARFQARLEQARATCQRLQDRTVEKTVAAAKAADHAVRTHPYETIGIALGLGLLIGTLAARR